MLAMDVALSLLPDTLPNVAWEDESTLSPKKPLSCVINLSLANLVAMLLAEKSNLLQELLAVMTEVGVPPVEKTELRALRDTLEHTSGKVPVLEFAEVVRRDLNEWTCGT